VGDGEHLSGGVERVATRDIVRIYDVLAFVCEFILGPKKFGSYSIQVSSFELPPLSFFPLQVFRISYISSNQAFIICFKTGRCFKDIITIIRGDMDAPDRH